MNRRRFLELLGIAGSGVVLRPVFVSAAATRRARAFPSAFGFGAQTKGAFGLAGVTPKLYRVNSLVDPTEPGKVTLRDALMAPEPRIVIFDVGGYIDVKSAWASGSIPPYLYIAGQTAPGDGICLRNDPNFKKSTLALGDTHDVIIRDLRLRPGRVNLPVGEVQRGLAIYEGSYNIVVDHCSVSWGIDECLLTGSGVHDCTIQWCIVAEGLNDAGHSEGDHSRGLNHSYGLPAPYNFTDHHNLLAHVQHRVPNIAVDKVEVFNHVVYHTTEQAIDVNTGNPDIIDNNFRARLVRNYFKRLENWPTNREIKVNDVRGPNTNIHVRDNIGPSRSKGTEPQLDCVNEEDRVVCQSTDPKCGGAFPHPAIRVAAQSAQNAYTTLTDTANPRVGATRPVRDAVDARIIQQVLDGTGGLIDDPAQVGGYPPLKLGAPLVDTDGDGIPDAWEFAHGLSPTDATDAMRIAPNGYAHLENYLNELAGDVIP